MWALYVLGFLSAACWSVGTTALRALVPHIVASDQYAAAAALHGVYLNIGSIAGPVLGGALVAASA